MTTCTLTKYDGTITRFTSSDLTAERIWRKAFPQILHTDDNRNPTYFGNKIIELAAKIKAERSAASMQITK